MLGRRSEVDMAYISERTILLTKWKSEVGDVKKKENPSGDEIFK